MKNKTFRQSVQCAIKGIYIALKTEKNFKYYTVIAITFLLFNIYLQSTLLEYVILVITTMMVFALECVNTAIEHLANMIDSKYNQAIKVLKDISAGAVLFAGIGFFVSQGIILGAKLW